jgi:hypothetical protein
MSNQLRINVDDARVQWAFSRAPDVISRHLESGLDWGAALLAVDARRRAPAMFGTLAQSILAVREEGLQWVVRTGMAYARMVEEGTGPAAGRARYYPNPDRLLEVLRASPASRGYKWAKKGSRKRGSQDVELWLRSRAWAMSIYAKGTKPHPFMAPAMAANREKVIAVVRREVFNGVREVFGGAM